MPSAQMRVLALAALLAASIFVFATPASADLIYSLMVDTCTGGCGTAPFGTVSLHQVNATTVQVTETLATSVVFVKIGSGNALEFNITNSPTVTISGITTGFTYTGSSSASGLGNFGYAIACSGCGPGASSPLPGPLVFQVSVASGSLSITNFIANSGGFVFASDIKGTSGNTGEVATRAPEPASMTLLGVGLFGIGLIRRRRQR